MLSLLLADLRFAGRSLYKRPGFALICTLILAIGIGAVTVMFSTLNGVVLRPLPYQDPDQLVWVWGTTEGRNANSMSAVDYYDYRDQSDVFDSLAARLVWKPGRIITGKGEAEKVVSTKVSGNLFATLGVKPLEGRSFAPAEEVANGPKVVVLSHGYWQRRFGAAPGVVGSLLTVDGISHEVVGVMPSGFDFPAGVELWFPMERGGSDETSRGNRNFFVVGRLADAVSIDQAQAQMEALAVGLEEAYPHANRAWRTRLVPLHEVFFGDLRPAMLMLMGAVAVVLLIACANASSLLLARVASRRNEVAVRTALGATRGAVVRQLLTESLALASLGAVTGVGFAYLGLRVLRNLGSVDVPRLETVSIDATALGVAAAAAVLGGLLAGFAPALRMTQLDPFASLKEGGRTTEGGHGLRLRSLLVGGQVALSLMLLIGSGLLIRSFLRLQQVDPGFDPQSVLTVDVLLPAAEYEQPEKLEAFFAGALGRIRGLPGVLDASAVDQLPLNGGPWNYVWPADRPPSDPSEKVGAVRRMAMEDYFGTLRVPFLAGRGFEPTDRIGSPPVVVVSRTLAQRFFPEGDALGEILILPWGDGIPLEIVGVVGDVTDDGLGDELRPTFYLPFRQYPDTGLRLVARTQADPVALVPTVRQLIRELEPNAPVSNVGTLEAAVVEATTRSRFLTALLGVFAAIAVLLAATGLYGALAYFVSQRSREMGIRIALGARPAQLIGQVVRRGALIVGVGITLGLLGGLGSSRLLAGLLYATAPMDPAIFAMGSSLLALVALAACVAPAWRATKVNPILALRDE